MYGKSVKICRAQTPQNLAFHTISTKRAHPSGGKASHTHTLTKSLNPSTSAKPVMSKLVNLFVSLVNMNVFQMKLKFRLYSLWIFRVICVIALWAYFCVCRMFADVCSVCTICISMELSLTFSKLKPAYGRTPIPELAFYVFSMF